jgi:DNA repair exonuclease SbcCD ATPase subunit
MKIICEKVGFRNFLSFGDKWQEIHLHRGMNLVTGWDKDRKKSNGAGKSSFLESIPFALFGKTAREIKKEQIVNWKNQKNCEVSFCFSINDTKYEVLRALKPDKFEIYKNGNLLDQTADKRDYQKEFDENIFRMDLKMFMNIIHSNLNDSAKILSLSKADKRKFMEKMFGLEIYSAMNEICNEKIRNIKGKMTSAELLISTNVEKYDDAEKMIVKLKEEIGSKKVDESLIEQKEKELKELKKHGDLTVTLKELKEKEQLETNAIRKKISEIEVAKTEASVELKHVEQEIKGLDSLSEAIENNKKIEERTEKICEKLNVKSVDEIAEKVKQKTDEKDELDNIVKSANEKYYEEKTQKVKEFDGKVNAESEKIVEAETELKTLKNNLKLLKKGVCPVCRSKVEDPENHYKDEIKEKEEEIEKHKKVKSDIEKKKSEYEKRASTEAEKFKQENEKKIEKLKNDIKILDKAKQTVYELVSKVFLYHFLTFLFSSRFPV